MVHKKLKIVIGAVLVLTLGAGLFILYPKGVTSHLGDSSDTSKDRIQAGFQPTPLTNDDVYYRQ